MVSKAARTGPVKEKCSAAVSGRGCSVRWLSGRGRESGWSVNPSSCNRLDSDPGRSVHVVNGTWGCEVWRLELVSRGAFSRPARVGSEKALAMRGDCSRVVGARVGVGWARRGAGQVMALLLGLIFFVLVSGEGGSGYSQVINADSSSDVVVSENAHRKLCAQPAACAGRCGPNAFVVRCALECSPCPAGSLSPPWGWSIRQCVPCNPGTFCQNCANVNQAAVNGAIARAMYFCRIYGLQCDADMRRNLLDLQPGLLNQSSLTPYASPAAVQLRGGAYPAANATSRALQSGPRCSPCPSGTVQPAAGQMSCNPCGPGTFSIDSRTCAACPPGTFSNAIRAAQCTPCPAGTIQPLSGQSGCVAINPGSYAKDGQALPCPPGSFQDRPGQSSCNSCPPGRFQLASGSVSCHPCAEGTFKSAAGAGSCRCCGANTFAAGAGNTRCSRCPPGSHTRGASCLGGCGSCAAGTYSDGRGRLLASALDTLSDLFSPQDQDVDRNSSQLTNFVWTLHEGSDQGQLSPDASRAFGIENEYSISLAVQKPTKEEYLLFTSSHRGVNPQQDEQPVLFTEEGLDLNALPRTGLSLEEEMAAVVLYQQEQDQDQDGRALQALPRVFIPGAAVRIRQGNRVGIVNLPLNYVVSFDVLPNSGMNLAAWRNIIHLTTASDYGTGFRLPGVWFCHSHAGCPGGPSALHICWMVRLCSRPCSTPRVLSRSLTFPLPPPLPRPTPTASRLATVHRHTARSALQPVDFVEHQRRRDADAHHVGDADWRTGLAAGRGNRPDARLQWRHRLCQ